MNRIRKVLGKCYGNEQTANRRSTAAAPVDRRECAWNSKIDKLLLFTPARVGPGCLGCGRCLTRPGNSGHSAPAPAPAASGSAW